MYIWIEASQAAAAVIRLQHILPTQHFVLL